MNMLTLFGIDSAQPVSLAELLLIVAGTAMVIGVIAFLVIF
jgi:hypothetical protein